MWPEVEKAKSESRHELVLGGNVVAERIEKSGLDSAIFTVTTLNYLDIHECNLGQIPEAIGQLANLQTLVLHSNKLVKITLQVFQLTKLKLLDLSRNQIREIPPELDNLVNLVSLNLAWNELETFPKLEKTSKITALDVSNNKLKTFPDVCHKDFQNFSELKMGVNQIEVVPHEIGFLSALKLVDLGQNRIKVVPYELYNCSKLKVVNFKDNPLSDRRFLKLINQCHTKQIMDYIKSHSPKSDKVEKDIATSKQQKGIRKKTDSISQENNETPGNENQFKYTIKINHDQGNFKIIIDEAVKATREFFLGCIIRNVNFTEESFKKFIQIQNKLHEGVCQKRNASTIATHDLNKIKGELLYTLLPPEQLMIKPLNRAQNMSGAELFSRLQAEAQSLRKEKKRNTYSGIHKYLYLIEGHAKYPCVLDGTDVISFPPITNSDITKIECGTKNIFVEVTSSLSLHACKMACENLLKEFVKLSDNGELDVTVVKTVDKDGNLKVTYPSRADLNLESAEGIRISREN